MVPRQDLEHGRPDCLAVEVGHPHQRPEHDHIGEQRVVEMLFGEGRGRYGQVRLLAEPQVVVRTGLRVVQDDPRGQVVELLVGRSREGDEEIGRLDDRAVDVVRGDDHLGADVTAAGFGPVALEHGDLQPLLDGGQAQDLPEADHALAPEAADQDLRSRPDPRLLALGSHEVSAHGRSRRWPEPARLAAVPGCA